MGEFTVDAWADNLPSFMDRFDSKAAAFSKAYDLAVSGYQVVAYSGDTSEVFFETITVAEHAA